MAMMKKVSTLKITTSELKEILAAHINSTYKPVDKIIGESIELVPFRGSEKEECRFTNFDVNWTTESEDFAKHHKH